MFQRPVTLRVTPLAAACAAGFALSVPRIAAAADLPPVVVTAARLPQALPDTLAHTTVLTRADIERLQAIDLVSLLAGEAGVQFATNGGRGTATSLFLRGSPARQVLVLVDGVPLSRQDATGQVGIEHLMLDQVERVEIVRGNVSALYGSGAIGGVIQVFTRSDAAAPRASVRLEAGARGLLHGSAQGSGRWGGTQLSLGVSGERDKGYSVLDPARQPAANPDRDGYRNTSAALNAAHTLAAGHTLRAGWVHSDGRLDYDSAFATPADQQSSRTRKDLLHLSSENAWSARWHSRASLSSQRDDARYHESGDWGYRARYRTVVDSLNWDNTLRLDAGWTLNAGLDLQRQAIDADDGFGGRYRHARDTAALFGGAQARLGAHDLALNLRRDDVDGVDARHSGSLGWGWQLASAWRVTARVANAFGVAPLGYLYAPYFGNPALKAERARSGELGLQWAPQDHRLRATLFSTRIEDELEYDTASERFENLARTRNRGLELSYAGRIGRTGLNASVTAQDPQDGLSGQQRLRRSKRLASLAVSQDLGQGWSAGLALRHAGERPDTGGVTLAAYTVADLTAQWQASRQLQWFARIENLGNARYETAAGYHQPPRGVFVGLRWRLGA